MIPRHQLPVYSPISPAALARGAAAALGMRPGDAPAAARAISERHGARAVALTDSGTSALVLALRLAVGARGVVALPGYGCSDLTSAALAAGVRVRLYDLDPRTLGPDLDSVQGALCAGARAVVLVHLHGFPADAPALAELAAEFGATVIEDAAQAAGGSLGGTPLGGFGPLAVLSFGRGKGTTGGAGGALLATTPEWVSAVEHESERLGRGRAGWAPLAAAAAQWLLGRPALYALPSAVPMLRLGEMVYHEAHEPEPIPRAVAAVLRGTLLEDAAELNERRANAATLVHALAGESGVTPVRPIAHAEPGWLRLPVLADAAPAPRLGVLRGYPMTLAEHSELRPILLDGALPLPGSELLRDRLLTLPTHRHVGPEDVRRIADWLRRPGGQAIVRSRYAAAH